MVTHGTARIAARQAASDSEIYPPALVSATMSKLLQQIRDEYDRAAAEAEGDGAAPEGIATIDAARILYEQWAHDQLVLVEAASPKAA